MTKLDLPVEDNESVNSASLSSNENGSVSNRSIESSLSLRLNPNSPPIPNERNLRHVYSPNVQIQNQFCREQTLDAVLVIASLYLELKKA